MFKDFDHLPQFPLTVADRAFVIEIGMTIMKMWGYVPEPEREKLANEILDLFESRLVLPELS